MRRRFPCSFEKACHVLWAVRVKGCSLTEAALLLGLNVGTVCHVIHGRRYPMAYPIPLPGLV